MPSGEISQTTSSEGTSEVIAAPALPVGTVITNSGRVSSTRFPGQTATTPPFSRDELIALDDAIHAATEKALVRFSVYSTLR